MKKETRKYYFSVEGETEKWYLERLANMINTTPKSSYNVKFDCKVEKNPIRRVKGMSLLEETKITHIFDREGETPEHVKKFKGVLEKMSEAENLGKKIKYKLGYSNLSFELWIILHKADCNGGKMQCKDYLPDLKRAYGEDIDNFKCEKIFKKILEKLTIEDVISAVTRAEKIMQKNKEFKNHTDIYKGYEYCKKNPSLSIHESIYEILLECQIMKK